MPFAAPSQAVPVATAKEQDKTLSAPRREALARWVKAKRAALGVTQDVLAERWLATQPSISAAERGEGLGIAVIERIADRAWGWVASDPSDTARPLHSNRDIPP